MNDDPKIDLAEKSRDRRARSRKYLKIQFCLLVFALIFAGAGFTIKLFERDLSGMLWPVIAVIYMLWARYNDVIMHKTRNDLCDTIEEQQSMIQHAHDNFVKLSEAMKALRDDSFGNEGKN